MRTIVYGAGSVGGVVGARLFEQGSDVVLLGRLHGVPTPRNARLQGLANQFARERRPPASLSVGELRRLLRAPAA